MGKSRETLKWLFVAAGIIISIALILGIAGKFRKEPEKDIIADKPPKENAVVKVDIDKEIQTSVKVESTDKGLESTDNGAVSSGTEQTIQETPAKPSYAEETLKAADVKPNGEKVSESDQIAHEEVPEEAVLKEEAAGKELTEGDGHWFDNVPYMGENEVIYVDGDGDINKQVGTM